MIKTYYLLTKPGIIYGNALTALGGFFLASKGNISLILLIATLLGMSLVIASACVFNNFLDRNIDEKMKRTKHRALVMGTITPQNAIIFATILGVVGFFILAFFTNILTFYIGLVGFFAYLVLYGIAKRKTIHGTLLGTISGATPPVAGYCAVTNQFDIAALLLFFLLVFWQMPHFYAIAMYRLADYKSAGLPVLPVKKGITVTKVHMLVYITLFLITTALLTVSKITGFTFVLVGVFLGIYWLWLAVQGFQLSNTTAWAKKMFLFSLVIILLYSLLLAVNNLLP